MSEKHFWSHRNEIGFNRSRFCYESGWVQRANQFCTHCVHRRYDITLGSAYSDTAAVTSCSRQSQYVKSWIATNWIKFSLSLLSSSIYTASTALGVRQEVEQIWVVFYLTFLNVSYFLLERFLHLCLVYCIYLFILRIFIYLLNDIIIKVYFAYVILTVVAG